MELPGSAGGVDRVARREGFLAGAAVGAALVARPRGGTTGRLLEGRDAALALADALLDELTGGGVDLRRLARRWVEWRRDDGLGLDPFLGEALDHLEQFDAPITVLARGSIVAVAAALPAALASASPRAMISGSFHVARLLDPAEETALATVATVLASAALLEGRRDFVPEVVAALRANDAPPALLEAIRTIPRDPRDAPAFPAGSNPAPADAVRWLLWMAHHRPRGTDVLLELAAADNVAPSVGAIAGALFGARDGIASWPPEWLDAPGVAERRARAEGL
jgi:hypothetical protein